MSTSPIDMQDDMRQRLVPSPEGGRRGFFRVLFGNPFNQPVGTQRNVTIDIACMRFNALEDYHKVPVLVFGSDNCRKMIDLGFSCILIDRRSVITIGSGGRGIGLSHKLLAYEVAMNMFDEAIFLDFDCQQVKTLPKTFWIDHAYKDTFQASLFRYRYHKSARITWRKTDSKLVPNGGYVYLRGKEIAKQLIQMMLLLRGRGHNINNEETVLAAYVDHSGSGWQGVDNYMAKHQPPHFHFGDVEHALAKPLPSDPFVHYCGANYIPPECQWLLSCDVATVFKHAVANDLVRHRSV